MVERSTDDRRIKKIKVADDKRKIRRRKEDNDNIKAYYGVLSLCFSTLFIIGLISFIWGR